MLSGFFSDIFEHAAPIRFEDHRHLRFSNREDYRFAASLAEVLIMSGERTLLQYLVQPMLDSLRRTFRER